MEMKMANVIKSRNERTTVVADSLTSHAAGVCPSASIHMLTSVSHQRTSERGEPAWRDASDFVLLISASVCALFDHMSSVLLSARGSAPSLTQPDVADALIADILQHYTHTRLYAL